MLWCGMRDSAEVFYVARARLRVCLRSNKLCDFVREHNSFVAHVIVRSCERWYMDSTVAGGLALCVYVFAISLQTCLSIEPGPGYTSSRRRCDDIVGPGVTFRTNTVIKDTRAHRSIVPRVSCALVHKLSMIHECRRCSVRPLRGIV